MTDLKQFDKSEYKKIPLHEINKMHINQKVCTFGWMIAKRNSKSVGCFLDVFAHHKLLKCLYGEKIEDEGLTRHSTVDIYGTVRDNPTSDGSDVEFHVDHFEVRGSAPPVFPVNRDSSPFVLLEQGHLALRLPERRFFLRARAHMLRAFREFFHRNDFTEITPPTLVQTQVEGGSTLFKLDYFGRPAYLTQTSQLYLETVLPVALKTYCIESSYRAEKSNTTRHLSEYTHVEAEMGNIAFEDLLALIEAMVCAVVDDFYTEFRAEILALHQGKFEFYELRRPFKRITYAAAIDYLNEQGYKKESGLAFVQGDDIPDAAEVFLVKSYGGGNPIFLTHFETTAKPFYMKTGADARYTESTDLLFPNLGEILGGSMRKTDYGALLQGLKDEKIDPTNYYWYLDMARYGACEHGGFGLGFERLLTALMRWKNVNRGSLYPRFVTRCHP